LTDEIVKQLQIMLNKSLRYEDVTLDKERIVSFKDKNDKIHAYRLPKGLTVRNMPSEDIAKDMYLAKVLDNMREKDPSLFEKLKNVDYESLICRDQKRIGE
jgi:hypothetical protein